MEKIVIYQISDDSYSTKVDSYGDFILITKDGNYKVPNRLLVTFKGLPEKIVETKKTSEFVGVEYQDKLYSEIEFLELKQQLGFKQSIVTDFEDWYEDEESFLTQFKFHKSYKNKYETVETQTEHKFVIVQTSVGEKYIEPVVKFSSKDEDFYLVTFNALNIIRETAAKYGFINEGDRGYNRHIENQYGYSCSESSYKPGNSLKFKFGYSKNTNLGEEKIYCNKYPCTLEKCKAEIQRFRDIVEQEFIIAKEKINPKPASDLLLMDIYNLTNQITDSVRAVSYNKKNECDYNSAIKNLKTINDNILNSLKK